MSSTSQKGFTLMELLIVLNIVAILAGTASIALSENSDEARCLEFYTVFAQIIRSQKFHYMHRNEYYSANHNEFKDHGVDLSEVGHFTYSTLPNAFGSFSMRADAGVWAPRGWVLYDHMGDPLWSSKEFLIKSNWLPG